MSKDGSELGPTCHFEGESSTCGKCIARSCQTAVNGCCGDSSCKNSLSTLDGCAQNGGLDCALLQSYGYGTPTTAMQKLGACVSGSCASACNAVGGGDGGGSGRSPLHPGVWCSGSADSCSCYDDTTLVNAEICDDTTVDNAVCCQGIGWPDRDLSCSCRRFACKDTTSGCECSGSGSGNKNTCEKKAPGYHCCATDYSTCKCTAAACPTYEKEVTSCTKAIVTCSSDQQKTTRCN
ncbi:hypothetical protein LVJ94_27635 [Pendulispora rubella]|uniref:Uncharacterized protein n=1 Tax=Pendulispora rubella TaxID=2741070 RepID=A0ABZ2KPU1_9BACT